MQGVHNMGPKKKNPKNQKKKKEKPKMVESLMKKLRYDYDDHGNILQMMKFVHAEPKLFM